MKCETSDSDKKTPPARSPKALDIGGKLKVKGDGKKPSGRK